MKENIIISIWNFYLLSAPYLFLGFILAGFFHILIPFETLSNWIKKKSFLSILKAAAIGVPLPLCSCGVIPAAVSLKKAGASNGTTSAFLISTPETGLDSIFVTYALMDFPMTVIRPISAFITAMFAGLLQHWFNDQDEKEVFIKKSTTSKIHHEHEHEHNIGQTKKLKKNNIFSKIRNNYLKIWNFAFIELLDDLVYWLCFGLLLGALINYFIPENFFMGFDPLTSKFVILLVGIPMYICASATTPIAASLIMKGMSPGTALILLLTGPATNITNIIVIQKYIGKKGTLINLLAISISSFGLSYVVDFIYSKIGPPQFQIMHKMNHDHAEDMGNSYYFTVFVAIVLIVLIGLSLFRVTLKKYNNHKENKLKKSQTSKDNNCCNH